jgi:membrane dipeptidase
MFIVDAHLDLAYNAIRHKRNLLKSVTDIRQGEEGNKSHPNGISLVSFPDLREANVGLVFGTIFVMPGSSRMAIEGDESLTYRTATYHTADQAHQAGQKQLDYYHRLADEVDYIRLVGNISDLDAVVASYQEGQEPLVGIVPLMEGADPIREPAEAEMWYERGLRIVGLAWDDTRYAAGAWGAGGGLTKEGHQLLEVMANFGFILDLTHMSEEASLTCLDEYDGTIIASHSNARALVPSPRQLSDTQIRRIAERDGVIGIVFANSFLKADHPRTGPKEGVTLEHVVAHIDHICQVVGDAAHIGIGTDFDGGFGVEAVPAEIKNLSDLPLIGKALNEKGYSKEDIEGIMGQNWIRTLRRTWS